LPCDHQYFVLGICPNNNDFIHNGPTPNPNDMVRHFGHFVFPRQIIICSSRIAFCSNCSGNLLSSGGTCARTDNRAIRAFVEFTNRTPLHRRTLTRGYIRLESIAANDKTVCSHENDLKCHSQVLVIRLPSGWRKRIDLHSGHTSCKDLGVRQTSIG
jgi:hypothetical protein